nr:penicillin-binding protein [Treponema phagedenis]
MCAVNTVINKKRLAAFILFLFLCFALLVFQYAKYMLFREPEIKEPMIVTARGSILDRNGKILAVETTLYNLIANKNLITDNSAAATVLAPILDVDISELTEKLKTSRSNFMYLKKKMSETEMEMIAKALKDNKLSGFRLEAIHNRTYPENSLASTVVGYLGDDGKGLSGVEYSLQNLLSPPPTIQGYTGSGYNIMLSIDSNIQYIMEKIGEQTMKETKAEGLMFLAVDAKTGQMLSYVNLPCANLSDFTNSTEEQRFDRPAYFIYEPGSVFKVFSMASFLELGSTYDGESYTCDGKFLFTPYALREGQKPNAITCLRVHGKVTPRDIIRLSCNDGTAQISDKTDAALFNEKLRGFGFGSKTEIELPGETAGLFAPLDRWSYRTKHTIAMGQEIGVSALQMVEAATALTNGGIPLKLSLLHKIYTSEGACVYTHKNKPREQVISAQVAKTVLSYMQTAAEEGTGHRALVGGVPIAVKTGTAQMANTNGRGYSKTDYVASCMGIFPANNPEIILYMVVIKPVGQTYGELIAAPAISKAANEIIDYRGMLRTNAPVVSHSGLIPVSSVQSVEIGVTMPNLIGKPKRLLAELTNRKDITVIIRGEGYVVAQKPDAGMPVTKGMTIELDLR